MPRILVDLSHNESYNKIPEGIFGLDYIFDFVGLGDPFPTFDELRDYDLIIMGEILPGENQKDHLFLKTDVENLKKYVYTGGSLLVTSSSGGDFDYKASEGSIRALKNITGVTKFWWGQLLIERKGLFYEEYENLIVPNMPKHPIFSDIRALLLVDSTFLKPANDKNVSIILETKKGTKFKSFEDEAIQLVNRAPLIVLKSLGYGLSLTIGSSFFMTTHPLYGYKALDNAKFFRNAVNWLIEKK